MLRSAQAVIDLASGVPGRRGFILGSLLSSAFVWRGCAKLMVGQKGWRQDLDRGVEMARDADPMSHAAAASYMYATGVSHGVILVDDADVGEIETALQRAERSSDHAALVLVHLALGIALIHHGPADRERGFDVLAQVRDTCV